MQHSSQTPHNFLGPPLHTNKVETAFTMEPIHFPVLVFFFKETYCKESMYSMFKDKLQNCSLNQFQ